MAEQYNGPPLGSLTPEEIMRDGLFVNHPVLGPIGVGGTNTPRCPECDWPLTMGPCDCGDS